jgi:hypothetical protein
MAYCISYYWDYGNKHKQNNCYMQKPNGRLHHSLFKVLAQLCDSYEANDRF